jgi:thioredoxin-dependent peroxiredoxin
MLHWFFGSPLAVGTAAPDFSLRDESGETVALSKLRGHNVVLVFYPADDTMVCRKQLCEFRDAWSDAQAKNVVVLGVNPGRVESHASFKRRNQFPFPLLVDEGQKVAKRYRSGGLIVRRTVYLIDTEGVIRFSRRGKPEPAEVLSSLDSGLG